MPFTILDPSAAKAAPSTTVGQPKTGIGKSLLDMRVHLKVQLGGRTDIDESVYNTWINDAYLDLCTSLEGDELKGSLTLTFDAGQAFYLLPSVVASVQTIGLVNSLSIYGGESLSKTDKASYRDFENASGQPRLYFREDNLLVVYPTPDKSYTVAIDFRVRPLRLENDTDCPILGEEFHRAILLRARADAFDDLQQFEKQGPAENSAVQNVRRRNDREAMEDEGRVIGSSVPGKYSPRKIIRRVR